MATETKLVSLLRDSDLVKEMRELKNVLEGNPEYAEAFQNLLRLQRKQIRAEAEGNRGEAEAAKASRTAEMARLTAFPAVSRYLDDCGELQDLMEEIQAILRDGLEAR